MKTLNTQKGYTLVELMVAIAIFVTVVVTSTTILINTLQESKRATQTRAVLDQTRIFMSKIQFEITNAKIDYFGLNQDCLGAGSTQYPRAFNQSASTELLFIAEDGICTGFVLDNGQVKKVINANDHGNVVLVPMTDPSIKVNTLRFRFFEDGLISQQPFVDVFIEVEPIVPSGIAPLGLQQTITLPVITKYNICAVGTEGDGVFCPFIEEDFPTGSVVVDFGEEVPDCVYSGLSPCVRGDTTDEDQARTQVVNTSIPSGTYRIIVATHDGHRVTINPPTYASDNNQDNETMHLHLSSTVGTTHNEKTGSTLDIPEKSDCQISVVEDALFIDESIEEVRGCISDVTWGSADNCSSIPLGGAGVANSLRAICAIFIPTS